MGVVAGLLLDDIRLLQGKRQGYPFSPLLFNLALNILSRYLSGVAPLHGVHIGRVELCTALFADNVLIFTSETTSDTVTIKNTLASAS